LQVLLNQTLYAGNNVLPNGLEGVADLIGRPKPMALRLGVEYHDPLRQYVPADLSGRGKQPQQCDAGPGGL
jgi:hypothetical protein